MSKEIGFTKEELYKLFITQNKTREECAAILGCTKSFISTCCKNWKINKVGNRIKKDDLYSFYILEGHTIEECGQHFYCGRGGIHYYLDKYGIKKTRKQMADTHILDRYKISKDDLYKLYIVDNLTIEECAKYFNCDELVIRRRLDRYGIKLKEHSYERKHIISKDELYRFFIRENHSLKETADKFGCSGATILLRCKEYGLKKLGNIVDRDELYQYYIVENHTKKQCDEFFNCYVDPYLQKYKILKPKDKINENTWHEKYHVDVDCLYDLYIIKNNTVEQCAEFFKCPKSKIEITLRKNNIHKVNTVPIPKDELYNYYIEENHTAYETAEFFNTTVSKVFYWANKVYGIKKDVYKANELAQKKMRENKTFNSSKQEDLFYEYLINKYGKDDIIRQYKEQRYPFNCDFYIKSKDIFIELNLNWTHGREPFNAANPNHLQRVKTLKERSVYSDFYKIALNVWTERDPNKIKTAKLNNLNYVMYYDVKDLYDGRV